MKQKLLGHQSLQEILSQPQAWRGALREISAKRARWKGFFHELSPDQILFVACGSTYYLSLAAAWVWQRILEIPARALPSSELVLFPEANLPRQGKPLLVAVSRSGETSETLWAVSHFRQRWPDRVVAIGCAQQSPLVEMADFSFLLPDAYEASVPQTRSFSAMYWMATAGGFLAADRPDLFQELERVPDLAERILEESQALGEEFGHRRDWHSVLFLGSGPLYGLAQEGALKMIEMGGTPASAYHFLEVRHGPNAIIDSGTLVVGLLSQGGLRYELAVLRSLIQQQEATVIALSPTNDPQPFRAHSFAFGLSDFTQGLAYLPALQLLAYHRAVSRGIDPDRPPHLTPFVRLTPEGG